MLGEVRFDARGRCWSLVFTVEAFCAIEQRTGKDVEALATALSRPTRKLLGELVWAGLRTRHPEVDVAGARRLMRAVGAHRMARLVVEALGAAFPREGDPQPDPADARRRNGKGAPRGWLHLFVAWIECGGEPDAFWRQTPRLIAAAIKGRVAVAEAQAHGRAWAAYHTAALGRTDKFPRTFKQWFRPGRPKAAPGRRSPDEQLAIARAWAARGVGTIQ